MDRTYPTRPIACVLAVVQRGASFLLVRRGQAPKLGLWGFPGGVQEVGETIGEAASRELFEETGLIGTNPLAFAAFDIIEREDSGRVLYHYALIAVRLDTDDAVAVAGSDAMELGWFSGDDLTARGVLPDVARLAVMVSNSRQ